MKDTVTGTTIYMIRRTRLLLSYRAICTSKSHRISRSVTWCHILLSPVNEGKNLSIRDNNETRFLISVVKFFLHVPSPLAKYKNVRNERTLADAVIPLRDYKRQS